MQITIYYREEDRWLIQKLEQAAYAQRKSVSQVIMTALEQYFLKQGELPPRQKGKPRHRHRKKREPERPSP